MVTEIRDSLSTREYTHINNEALEKPIYIQLDCHANKSLIILCLERDCSRRGGIGKHVFTIVMLLNITCKHSVRKNSIETKTLFITLID